MERIKYLLNGLKGGLTERSFLGGFFIGFWPSLYFIFFAIAEILRFTGIPAAANLYSKFIAVPLVLIFYEAVLILITGFLIILNPDKRAPVGTAYGIGVTLALIIFLGIAFGLTNLVSGFIR